MSSIIQIRCDICGKILEPQDIETNKSLLNFSGKPISKYNFSYKLDVQRKGDLCFGCVRAIREFIENRKEGKK